MGHQRNRASPLTRPKLITELRKLGYEINAQQDAISALSGVVVSQAAELDALEQRLLLLEGRQPASFGN